MGIKYLRTVTIAAVCAAVTSGCSSRPLTYATTVTNTTMVSQATVQGQSPLVVGNNQIFLIDSQNRNVTVGLTIIAGDRGTIYEGALFYGSKGVGQVARLASGLDISVDGKSVYSRIEAFADLAELTAARLSTSTANLYCLTLEGGSGTSSYVADILFDSLEIVERRVRYRANNQDLIARTYLSVNKMEDF